MGTTLYLALITMGLAYAFDFVNGFHDTANAVTTIIYTKAMKARAAIIMSGVLNFLRAVIVGTAVAMIITKLIPKGRVTTELILAALIGGLIWNIGTWYQGLPVSSSHTLVGGLFGAGLAANWLSGVHWSALTQIVLALLISPFIGMGLSWRSRAFLGYSQIGLFPTRITTCQTPTSTGGDRRRSSDG